MVLATGSWQEKAGTTWRLLSSAVSSSLLSSLLSQAAPRWGRTERSGLGLGLGLGCGYLTDHVGAGEFLLQRLIIRPHQEESYIEVVMKLARLILGSLKQRGLSVRLATTGLRASLAHLVNLSLVQSHRHQPPCWDVSFRSCM